MNKPDLLLFGANGQLAWELRRTLSTLGNVVSAGLDGGDHRLDITNEDDLTALVEQVRPALMINATAYTAVDKAESEPELAQEVNADALTLIGELAAAQNCLVLHYSTDYVFPGTGNTPWKEDDQTEPLSVYGRTKLAGERALAESGCDYLILRTAWVYGARGNNFLLTMLRLFQQKPQLNIVADQFGAPTWSRHLAEISAQMMARLKQGERFELGDLGGIYHATAAGQASWYEFAEAILALSGKECSLSPITSDQYPCAATRPKFSVLDNSKLANTFALSIPDWRIGLRLCMEEIGA